MTIYICLSVFSFFQTHAQDSFLGSLHVDSVVAVASSQYKKTTLLKRIFIGSNYSKEWSKEVKMPVFHLNDFKMKIIELGGGQQTKSLKLEDEAGREWALRTIEKDASGAVPKALKSTFAERIVQDIISGAHPYAPLVVAHLAKAAGIIAPDPKLFFIPADAGLGKYQEVFSGKVCFLEQKAPTRKGNKETMSTANVQEEIIEDNDHLIIQREVLRARLLDMLIADWDRHSDQWRWGEIDSTKAKYYYAIPRDRDQAFFMANGLIPVFGKFIAMHHINWFKNKSKGLIKLNYKSWNFDQTFINDLDATEWKTVFNEFKNRLTDKVIAEAVKKLPPEIYSSDGKEIEAKLISRLRTMEPAIMKYYSFLSRQIQVQGTNEDEIFQVSNKEDNLIVSVYRKGLKSGKNIKVYERVIKGNETKEIILLGYNGDDQFKINLSSSSNIKIKIYGDKGKDQYFLEGHTNSSIYDLKNEANSISSNKKIKIFFN